MKTLLHAVSTAHTIFSVESFIFLLTADKPMALVLSITPFGVNHGATVATFRNALVGPIECLMFFAMDALPASRLTNFLFLIFV
jgi:hypothetical protein